MTPMYRVLRWVLQGAVELFYVDVRISGRERVPDEGPVIFVANHPNSIMDSVILGTQIDRPIHYLAKSELFRNPVVAWVFDRCGVIPLYKNPGAEDRNDEAFRSAFELLGEGGCLGIFPEGRNSLERGILELKTGAARIALGAETRHDYELGVRVVPVGLNFENRDRFMTRVVARVGRPIDARGYADAHRRAERETVREMTDDIETALREVVADMEDDRVRRLAEQVDRIYGRDLVEDMIAYRRDGEASEDRVEVVEYDADDERDGGFRKRLFAQIKQAGGDDAEDFARRLWAQDRIADAVEYYEEVEPGLVRELQVRVQRYVDHLDQLRIRGDLQERDPANLSARWESMKLTLYALGLALPAAWGFVNNLVPYNLTRIAALKAPDEPMRAFAGLLVGSICFTLFYLLQAWGVLALTPAGAPTTALYVLSLPVTGFFFLRYRRQVSKYRNRILVRTMFRSNRNLVDAVMAERAELVEAFDELRDHFREVERAQETDETPPPTPDLDLSPPLWGPPN